MSDLEMLTGSRAWSANPSDYNRLNFLTFRRDGSGQLVLAHAQSVMAVVHYRFEVLPGVLRLMFVEASSNELFFDNGELGRQLVAADRDTRELKYVLRTGDFRGTMNMGEKDGPFRYHYRAAITFNAAPYSEDTVRRSGHRQVLVDYTYYGHPVVNEPSEPLTSIWSSLTSQWSRRSF